MDAALTLLLAYLIGSIPVTWLIFYWRTGHDLRAVGDGNVGSANAIRSGAGFVWGHLALLADVGKGLLAVSIARWFDLEIGWWMAVGFLVMVGHMFPVWLRFQGGRAAATAMGAAGAFMPWQFGLCFAAAATAFLFFKIAELGILIAAAPLPFIAIAWNLPAAAIAFAFAAPVLAALKTAFDHRRLARRRPPARDPAESRA